MAGLTRTERRLRAEVEEIASLVEMDVSKIDDYAGVPRRHYLTQVKDRLIRSEIVLKYTLIDEFLTDIICLYYFRKPKQLLMFRDLWRTKRFRVFVHYIMDEMALLKK